MKQYPYMIKSFRLSVSDKNVKNKKRDSRTAPVIQATCDAAQVKQLHTIQVLFVFVFPSLFFFAELNLGIKFTLY